MSDPDIISRKEMESMLPAEEQERIRQEQATNQANLDRLSAKVSELAAKVREEEHRPCREREAALTAQLEWTRNVVCASRSLLLAVDGVRDSDNAAINEYPAWIGLDNALNARSVQQ